MNIGKHINEETCNNIYNNIWFLTDKSVNSQLRNFAWCYIHDKVIRNSNEITNIRL